MTKPYRPCVGIMLINDDKKIWLGKNVDFNKGPWQMPQGGVDGKEPVDVTARRELAEETSITNAKIIKIMEHKVAYDYPEHMIKDFRGQEQSWVLMQYLGDGDDINIDTEIPEFSQWQWVDMDFALANVVDFKHEVYQKVFAYFSAYLTQE